jgi:Flp pilus assembly pilin Flp
MDLVIVKRFDVNQNGQGLFEYALLLALVAIVVILLVASLGTWVNSTFSKILNPLGTDSGQPSDPPPECYNSLLLPIMVGATGLGVGLARWFPKRLVENSIT